MQIQTCHAYMVFVVSQSADVRQRFRFLIGNDTHTVITMTPWRLPLYIMMRRIHPRIIFLDNASITQRLVHWINHSFDNTEIILIVAANQQVRLPSAILQVRPNSTKEQIQALLP